MCLPASQDYFQTRIFSDRIIMAISSVVGQHKRIGAMWECGKYTQTQTQTLKRNRLVGRGGVGGDMGSELTEEGF